MKSAWRFEDGGSQIADLLLENLRDNGVEVLTGRKVTKFVAEKRTLKWIEIENGEKIFAEKYISTMHPQICSICLKGTISILRIVKKYILLRILSGSLVCT